MNNFDDIYSNIEDNFIAWCDEFQEGGSGFVFKQIIKSTIHLLRTNRLRASSNFSHDLGLRTSILNIQNTDQKWSILAKLFPPEGNNHTTKILNYTPYKSHLNMNGIEYSIKKRYI